MTLQQVAGSEPAIIRGKDFLIVPEWIHNPHSYSMTIGSDELSIGIKTDDGEPLSERTFNYKGLYSLPVPGIDIGLSEVYASLRDYDNAIVVNSEYYGVSVSKLILVEDDFGAGRGILLSKESGEIKDSDSSIWLDPKRSDVVPDDREIICIFSHTAIPDNYYWSKHGPFKKEFDESLDCLSRLFNALGPHFSAVFSDLEDAYMNMPIKDTYEPGVYKTRKSNSLVVKMRFMPSVCWSFYGRKLTSEFCSFPQLVRYIGKDEFPLEAVAES